jgi:NAD(P)-dependent dehydrogenase (short-subunit alcohol dehydrogenase family)
MQPRYPEFKGKAAIVTGSSRGIGKGIALRLAREGMKVVINGVDPDRVRNTTLEFLELGIDAVGIPANVGDSREISHLFEQTMALFGTLDLLVNNAADLRRVPFFEVDKLMLENQLTVNIQGPYNCSYRAAEIMKAGGGGNIIHISSVGGLRAHKPGLPYDVTKGALDAMTRAMALSLAEFGIRVNAVAPGAIRKERTPPPENQRSQSISRRIPLGRFGLPEEIGSAVAFLASPDADYITGQVLYVDGGITTQLSPKESPL